MVVYLKIFRVLFADSKIKFYMFLTQILNAWEMQICYIYKYFLYEKLL